MVWIVSQLRPRRQIINIYVSSQGSNSSKKTQDRREPWAKPRTGLSNSQVKPRSRTQDNLLPVACATEVRDDVEILFWLDFWTQATMLHLKRNITRAIASVATRDVRTI